MTKRYNIEASISVEKEWSRDEVLGKLTIALGGVGIVESLKCDIIRVEDGARLNRDMQIATGNIVTGKLTKEELELQKKGINERMIKAKVKP